jgi:Arc/MetJ-type ribon-helix-helix transcriptional regulator
MRTTKTISITIPPEMLERASLLAKKEDRTMSEFIREAIRYYERSRFWEETNSYGRTRATELNLTENDVQRLIDETRSDRHLASHKQQ